jgi:dihydroorotase
MDKRTLFNNASSGIPGVETMVPLLLAEVQKNTISLSDVINKTSIVPAALLGISPAGFSPGSRADFAIYPKEVTRIDPDSLHSKCGWTPFAGHPAIFPGTVILNGIIVYKDGDFTKSEPAWIPGNGYIGNS